MGLLAWGPRHRWPPPALAAAVATLVGTRWAPAEAARASRTGSGWRVPSLSTNRTPAAGGAGGPPRAGGAAEGASARDAARASGGAPPARPDARTALHAELANTTGGTACRCVCGHTIVWRREIFRGNVVREKEYECEEKVCPAVSIPGLVATGECTYVEDIQELTSGTVCLCVCGGRVAWRGRAFYGNVTKERERECLEEVCPVVNPIPGLQFDAKCRFVKNLFLEGSEPPASPEQPSQPRPDSAAKSAARQAGCVAAYLPSAMFFLWLA